MVPDYLALPPHILPMADPYETLLKKAYEHVTEVSESSERFTIPEVKSYIEGKATVFENFREIADTLRREPEHVMKFLVGELGTAGKIDGNRAIFNGKFDPAQFTAAVKSYFDDYVLCSECGRPDTRLVKDDRILILRCDACGSHRPVKKRKARSEDAHQGLVEGKIMDVMIQSVSKRGDGVAREGKYIMYVPKSKPGQTVKIKITRISGSIVFTERA